MPAMTFESAPLALAMTETEQPSPQQCRPRRGRCCRKPRQHLCTRCKGNKPGFVSPRHGDAPADPAARNRHLHGQISHAMQRSITQASLP